MTYDTELDGYSTHPVNAKVFRNVPNGPLAIGAIVPPTNADIDRCFHVHGPAGKRGPMVLVRWGISTSWEYTRDLRIIDPGPGPVLTTDSAAVDKPAP